MDGAVARVDSAAPMFGYRRLWVLLRFRDGFVVNRKVVYRVLKQKGWFVHQRVSTSRWLGPSRGGDRLPDREVIGYEFALRSRAKEAERAVEAACLQCFGILRPEVAPLLWTESFSS